MKDLNDLFNEVEDEVVRKYQERVASGEDAKDIERLRKKSEDEQARLEAHGCIEETNDTDEDE